jgi:hypothetical protein
MDCGPGPFGSFVFSELLLISEMTELSYDRLYYQRYSTIQTPYCCSNMAGTVKSMKNPCNLAEYVGVPGIASPAVYK